MICPNLKDCFLVDIKYLHPEIGFFSILKKCILNSGMLAVVLFRISQYLNEKKFLWRLSPYVFRMNQILTGFECHIGAKIDEGLFIPHSQNIVIGQDVVIGRNVTIYNGVTFGAKTMKKLDPQFGDEKSRYPIVGDNVVIFSGAKLIGHIQIGKNAIVGANSVVLKDIPEGKTAVGIPAKLVD